MDIIRIDHLTKQYRNGRGINNLSLTIGKGEVFGLLGPNGSGKTTTFKVLTGLIEADLGLIEIFGKDITDNFIEIKRKIGCLIESPGLYPYLTAEENLKCLSIIYPEVPLDRSSEVLKTVGLSKYANEKISNYSLGMKQRMGLAMALYTKPDLYILDEPTNGLDISGISQLRNIIKGEAESGSTVLISSHLAHEIEQICTKIGIIIDGKLLAVEKVSDVLKSYDSIEDFYLKFVEHERKENKS